MIFALLPQGKALDVAVISIINGPDAEYFALKHEIGVAVVVGIGCTVNFYGIKVPKTKPVTDVAVVVGAAAQCYQNRYSKNDV